jgi:hypothetical protein
MADQETEDLKAALSRPRPKTQIKPTDLLSSGSTVLNLGMTNTTGGAFAKGRYYYFVGDSGSGKSWFSLTMLAEAARSPRFEGYKLVYDGPEGGALMDKEFYFGKKLTDRLEEPVPSDTVEQFYRRVVNAVDAGPTVYVLDSMDVIPSEEDIKSLEKKGAVLDKLEAGKKLSQKDLDVAGSYGTGKAKCNSTQLRILMPKLQATGSILFVISQTRDNINAGPYGEKQTRAGGRALTFYATQEVWTSVKTSIKKTVNSKERTVGREVNLRIKKNRVVGRDRTVAQPFYYSHGIDDTGGCVKYLMSEKVWESGKAFPELGAKSGTNEEALVAHVEANNLEKDLRALVKKTWDEIEAKCVVNRKRKYE